MPFGAPAPPGDPFHINDAFLHRVDLDPAGPSYGRVVPRWNLFANHHLGRFGNDYAAGGADVATGVALSRARDVFVTGYSGSDDLYTSPGARQRYATQGLGTSPNDNDAFVVQFDGPDDDAADDVQIIGGFEYATYLGGAGDDRAHGIAVDASERAYIGGGTTHDSFPTTANAYQRTSTSQPTLTGAGFVSTLLESGSALAFSTLLGGHTTSIHDIAIDDANRPFVTGETRNPADGDAGGGVPGGGPMLGGGGNPSPDESEDAHGTFPLTPDATDREQGAGPRAFLSWLAADGMDLLFSTFHGSRSSGHGVAVRVTRDGGTVTGREAVVAGAVAQAGTLPVPNAEQPESAGGVDGFVAKWSGFGLGLLVP